MKMITPAELEMRMLENNDVIILDVRAEEKYLNEHIAGSINIEKTHILSGNESEAIQSLPKNKELIITCTTGNSARKCAEILTSKEYNVTLLEGGMTAWKANKNKSGSALNIAVQTGRSPTEIKETR
ncbi:rhodanese-related sulfurtransferase [Cytobacillus eiseniae]|uniref:Rhodanese-related sulfurtransferase n=1 Tax=Cytobacillus eiseniae TaxID=762947 RepID=A0ABS4RBV2_9BACI|nr:rhodanese-like domain-containing protein [Cytobacillus eiseniae]MBP2239819.1 rhodanese-related sulfurtransferase [Cytobacillus eiseniae]